MPVVADFTLIQGDSPVRIGDGNPIWEKTFNTGGRHASVSLIMLNIKGLTHADQSVAVKVNNVEVGRIFPYAGEGETANNWYTQMVALGSTRLNSGNNELQIEAVSFDGATPTNLFDDFFIKDVVCFFHQSA